MPARIKMAKERRIIARLMIDLLKLPAEAHLKTRHYSSRCDDVMLMCAILIGQVERKPMTAAKLADYAGMPRPTVIRKLRQFERAGMVELSDGMPVGVPTHMNPANIEQTIRSLVQSIKRAAAELSKLDNKDIANEPPST